MKADSNNVVACYVQVRSLGRGDTVRVVNDEQAVRAMQTGHGGWNSQMKNVRTITLRN